MSTNFERLREIFKVAVEQHSASQWDTYLDEDRFGPRFQCEKRDDFAQVPIEKFSPLVRKHRQVLAGRPETRPWHTTTRRPRSEVKSGVERPLAGSSSP